MRSLKKGFVSQIDIFSAFETKVTDFNGTLDMPGRVYGYSDFIYGAIHSLPLAEGSLNPSKDETKRLWMAAFQGLLNNPMIDVVAHPMAFLRVKQLKLSSRQQALVIRQMIASRKVFEINFKYKVPGEAVIRFLKKQGIKFTLGSDSHSIAELEKVWRG